MFKAFIRGFVNNFRLDRHDMESAGEFTGQFALFAIIMGSIIGLAAFFSSLFRA